MRSLESISDSCLKERLKKLYSNLDEFEKDLIDVKSYLYQLYIRSWIKKTKSEIHAIEAELLYRESNK